MSDRVCFDPSDTEKAIAPWVGSPMTRLMDGFWDYDFSPGFHPPYEMRESDSAITIIFEIPGIKKEDIHLDLRNGILRLRGERKAPELKKDEDCYCSELGYGTFERSFRLPDYVEDGSVKAKHSDGLLEIIIGKKEGKKRKALEIKVE